jgi:hypothetical protein
MRKFSKKGAVVFGAVLAVCAFVVPSMASAASWGVVGSEHTLTATDLGFLVNLGASGTIGTTCKDSSFTVTVGSAAALEITTASFNNCTGQGTLGTGCPATAKGTNFPWTVTGITTTNVQIHGVDIDANLGAAGCMAPGGAARVTGTLTGGIWNATLHTVTLPAAGTGLVGHLTGFGTFPIAITGPRTVIDRQGTLTLS